jgi:exopolysaccharide production protein ExoQ
LIINLVLKLLHSNGFKTCVTRFWTYAYTVGIVIRKILCLIEHLFVVSSLFLYTGGIFNVINIGCMSEGDLNYDRAIADTDKFILEKVWYLLTYAIGLLLLLRVAKRFDRIPTILLQNPYNLLLIGLTLLSILWSEIPALTSARSFALLGTTLFGVYLANRYTVNELVVLLGHTFFAIILLSILFVFVLPDCGIMGSTHAGAWRGIYAHKNHLGRLMVLAAIIFIIQPKRKFEANRPLEIQGNSVLINLIGLNLSIVLMVMSKSSGAIANLAILSIVLAVFKINQLNPPQRFFAISGSIAASGIVGTLVIPNPEVLFASINRSSDLSGRGDLWNILFDMIWQNPILGFGYGVFWPRYGKLLTSQNGWFAPDAHNGFLDLALSVGLLGLTLFTLSYLHSFLTALQRFRRTPNDEDLCQLVLFAYIVFTNMSESGLFAYNNIFWLLYITISHREPLGRKVVA